MMCRADVKPEAEQALAGVMLALRDALCAEYGGDPEQVTCGPVDFGGGSDGDE